MLAQVAVRKATRQKTKEDQSAQERKHTSIAEAQCGRALATDADGLLDSSERGFADRAVVTDTLDVEETSVGGEADLPQSGKVLQSFADLEVAGVVDDGFGPERSSLLVILLDAGFLVVDVQ